MERMTVIAPAGKTCPMERSREVIGDSADTTVPNTHYYRCRIASGELIFKGHVGKQVRPQAVSETLQKTINDNINGSKKRGGSK